MARRSAVLPIAALLMLGFRALVRTIAEEFRRPRPPERALIYGAGELGAAITRRLKTDQVSPYQPVGLIDDFNSRAEAPVAAVEVGDDGLRFVPKPVEKIELKPLSAPIIQACCADIGVSQPHLDFGDVCVMLQRIGRSGCPQPMHT